MKFEKENVYTVLFLSCEGRNIIFAKYSNQVEHTKISMVSNENLILKTMKKITVTRQKI